MRASPDFEARREYVRVYGLVPGARVRRVESGYGADATILAITAKCMIRLRYDELTTWCAPGEEKIVSPLSLRPR